VVGCGDPKLIDMYATETGCPFPIYADPTRKLYGELGMIRTLALGQRPAYMQKKSLLKSSIESVVQGLKQIPKGTVFKAGDQRQIGGEFLFEPLDLHSPISTLPVAGDLDEKLEGGSRAADEESGEIEGKRVTWCHRMKSTRDHAEVPELMEVLGLDGAGKDLTVDENKRWSKALQERKGVGLSMAGQMEAMKEAERVAAAAAASTAPAATSTETPTTSH
jgi:hypothetical protein